MSFTNTGGFPGLYSELKIFWKPGKPPYYFEKYAVKFPNEAPNYNLTVRGKLSNSSGYVKHSFLCDGKIKVVFFKALFCDKSLRF